MEAIYAEADLPPEFAIDLEFNAVQARKRKEAGQEAITQTGQPLPSAAEKKAALGY